MRQQLGREVRGVVEVAARCICGAPLVARTAPRLEDGSPFPTTYYLTEPGACAGIGRLESQGLMAQMNAQLGQDPALAAAHQAAHRDYLARRLELGQVPEIEGVSAGGMPDRVKCLHVLAAHSLAAGPGVNPLGDATLVALSRWWRPDVCTCLGADGGDRPGVSAPRGGGKPAADGAQGGEGGLAGFRAGGSSGDDADGRDD
ncbi:MAG: DUF501 domain-containing protein [Micrococcales bacterium]|nr:DUF501 domain-containing protein [Micrococcales bacterium]